MGHPSHIVCPCNSDMLGPCPYAMPGWGDVIGPGVVTEKPRPIDWEKVTATLAGAAATDAGERKAWECPRCHQVNAPHVDRCDCQP